MTALLPVADAQARLLALATPTPVEPVAIEHAAGRWAAADLVALRTQPARDLSAMDGYAVRFSDLPGPLRVVGESAAGRPFTGLLGANEAVRIFTGAAMPDGADCVLVQEEAARDDDDVRCIGEGPTGPGGNVRPRGLDFREGDMLVAAGERLTPARVALAAVGGVAPVAVHRRVRVTIFATGDELVRAGDRATNPDSLRESNIMMIAAQLAGLPCEVIDVGILPDRLDALTEAFRAARADIVVTTGGASVGDHDLVRPALEAAGGAIDFWRIALRPGKPMLAGRLGDAVFVGLPGNPVSAFVTTELFVKPLVARLSGAAVAVPTTVTAVLAEALPANGPRADYLRATLHDGRVQVAATQDSSMLRTLAHADCLVVRPPHAAPADAGTLVDILPIA